MWSDRTVLVTGGASFIGSHLVDSLLREKAVVKVADDFSSGRLKNLEYALRKKGRNVWVSRNLSIHRGDLKDRSFTRSVVKGVDTVFHLAACHGGRGYIHTHPVECSTNMALDQTVFEQSWNEGVERICFASSACVYPSYLQETTGSSYLLKEEDADPFVRDKALADLEYGWAKLMGEMTLRAYSRQYGMKTSCVRIFTCFHPDTRVLTPDGLRVISEFQIGDEVYTLNPETHEIEISRVLATQKIPFSGKTVRIHHKSVDWAVTPDHRMYYHPYRRRKCEFREASELLRNTGYQRMTAFHKPYLNGLHPSQISLWPYVDENHIVVVTPQNPVHVALARLQELGHERRPWTNKILMKKEEVDDPVAFEEKYHCQVAVRDHLRGCRDMPFRFPIEAFIQFLGWYITEGSVRRKGYAQISISQSARVHPDQRREIVEVLMSMGIPYSVGKREISVSSRMLRNFIEREVGVGSGEKRIPGLIFDLDLSYRKLFFDTLMKGDGHISGRRYTTKSPKLAEDFQHLAFLNGVNITSVQKDDNGYFRISIRRGRHSSIKPKHVSQLNYNGFVYCITANKNHIIYAGGRSLNWIGQCYGPRENETHAIIALIARAFIKMDPYVIWGTGEQDRNFTYVQDIVDALMLAAEKIGDGSAVNAGRDDRISLDQAAELVFDITGWRPKKVEHDLSKPQGVASRAADLTRAREILGWKPKVPYEEGFKKTIEWYFANKKRNEVKANLDKLLTER